MGIRDRQLSSANGNDQLPWLFSASADLLFLINVGWILAWLPLYASPDGHVHFQFWQIYFLTTPHRWITLLLVATDPDRRTNRSWMFIGLALLSFAIVGCIRISTGTFQCLLLANYLWNSWHFAAQHAGITRMYSRKAGGGNAQLETFAIRTLVFYTSIRMAGWATGWLEEFPLLHSLLSWLDLISTAPAAWLIATVIWTANKKQIPKLLYVCSVAGMYASLLFAVHMRHSILIASLTVASAAFHAIEYLAVVTFYAHRRREHGSAAPFQKMARHWSELLAAYLIILGVCHVLGETYLFDWWLGINLAVSFLHYAYDGMIWKLRQPQTAKTLNVEVSTRSVVGDPQQ